MMYVYVDMYKYVCVYLHTLYMIVGLNKFILLLTPFHLCN